SPECTRALFTTSRRARLSCWLPRSCSRWPCYFRLHRAGLCRPHARWQLGGAPRRPVRGSPDMPQRFTVMVMAACVALSGCAYANQGANDSGRIRAVTSFSILTDMVQEIGGHHVDVHNLVPTGTDPHEYVPKPDDIKRAAD